MSHHRIGSLIVAAALFLTIADGLWFAFVERIAALHGIYCIWMTAVTVGGDVAPTGWGRWCLALAPFPWLAAAIALFTSALASIHVRKSEHLIKKHVETQFTEHRRKLAAGKGPS